MADTPSIVLLEPAPHGLPGLHAEQLGSGRSTLVDMVTGGIRHLVLADGHGRHRLAVSALSDTAKLTCVVVPDQWLLLRMAAITAYRAPPRGKTAGAQRSALHPSGYQRHRLASLVRIADCLARSGPGAASLKEIAAKAIYPWLETGRSIDWKSSSERRQTQRLVSMARYMVEKGYRELLRGTSPTSHM